MREPVPEPKCAGVDQIGPTLFYFKAESQEPFVTENTCRCTIDTA